MFDPAKEREHLESPTSGYRRHLQRSEEEIREYLFPLGRSAIGDACACHFCGLEEGAQLLAELGQRLLREASLMGRLTSHPHNNRGLAFQSLALGHWLLNGEDDCESLEASSREYQASVEQFGRADSHTLDSWLPCHLSADNYEYVCECFENLTKSRVPKKLSSVRTSRVAAYIWAQHKLGDDYSREQAVLAAKSYLDKNLANSVLGRGHHLDAAIWLKILYWNDIENPPSPRDVLLKAYDHMPEVTRPF